MLIKVTTKQILFTWHLVLNIHLTNRKFSLKSERRQGKERQIEKPTKSSLSAAFSTGTYKKMTAITDTRFAKIRFEYLLLLSMIREVNERTNTKQNAHRKMPKKKK